MNESRKNCGTAIDKLGERKVAVLDGSIKKFISEFEKLNHVELSESSGLNELQKLVLDKKSFSDLKDLQGMASSLVGGLASGAMRLQRLVHMVQQVHWQRHLQEQLLLH